MAEAAEETADWTLGQIIAIGAEVVLLAIAIGIAWWAGSWAKRAAGAAKEAAKQARRQTDATILLEAAKIIPGDAYLVPPGGGVIQNMGVPGDGQVAHFALRNLGKTQAFLESYAAILKISAEEPPRRIPLYANKILSPDTVVRPGGKKTMESTTGPMPITEDETKELETGRKHLWLFGSVYYKDWFDLPRVESFTYRWVCGYEAGKVGFILHSRQSKENKNGESD